MNFLEWIEEHSALVAWLTGISLVTCLLSLFVLPLIVLYLPKDHFAETPRPHLSLHPVRIILNLLKNIFGLIFLAAGILMLFLPGQGILFSLLGISLIDFPGKRKLELKIIRMRKVRAALAWIRKKGGRPPLEIPEVPATQSDLKSNSR